MILRSKGKDSVSLSKVKKVDSISISKADPSLERAVIGLGWDATEKVFDLDLSAFMLNSQGQVRSNRDLIFPSQLRSVDGAVKHTGDSRDGAGNADDEQIKVNLRKVSPDIERIVFVVSIDSYEQRRQNFGQVSNAFVRLVNADNKREVMRYDLAEGHSHETALVFGELYRKDSGWCFKAICQGSNDGLRAACQRYGINVD